MKFKKLFMLILVIILLNTGISTVFAGRDPEPWSIEPVISVETVENLK
ncbi:hypothetical protein [Thermotalea metallivorans]|uniref:Uncharacterized protein n=1 Tax=Thermotalea metallivorans TaxID=520762 RepID=A0A140L1K7_9FIRM|nr:hypothetical protein [Thermotalea metallivorans]KXG74432.1 hypothetical protein AN619_23300 [Thermotalea metallivorans]